MAAARAARGRIRIGISGWTYGGWRTHFYPESLARRRELEFASRQFDTIEINGTFYRLQRPEHFTAWHAATPDDFVFAVKGSRFITHMKQLRDVRAPLANFFASGVLRLEEKLGPFLWQFSDRLRFDADRFEAFLSLLPRTTGEASRLARAHDARVTGRASFHTDHDRPLRHAVEVRNESFMTDRFIDMLRAQHTALVVSDAGSEWQIMEDVTADFVYLRLHGAEQLYASGYGDRALDHWASRARAWSAGREPADAQRVAEQPAPRCTARDVYVYFDNDAKVHAPFDAFGLADRLDIDWRFHHDV
jgi:uncharacterized protein YecE (DUF72 family)